jgi:hypothetical protein
MLLTAQPVQNDSLVSVVADAQGLQQLTPDQVSFGTFWLVQPNGNAVPCPCLPGNDCGAIFLITDGQYLVDNSGGEAQAPPRLSRMQAATSMASVVNAQADAVVALIQQVQAQAADQQSQTMARAMGMAVPSPGGGGFGDGSGGVLTNNYSAYTIDTNQLWLAITIVSNGWSYLNLQMPPTRFIASGAPPIC